VANLENTNTAGLAPSMRPWLLDRGGLAALTACVLAGFAVFSGESLAKGVAWPGWATSLPPALALLAALVAGWRSGASLDLPRPRRLAWRLIALGLAVLLCACVAAGVLELAGLTASARQAQLLRVGFYPLVATACILLMRSNRSGTPRARFWLDSLAVSLSFGAVLWIFLFGPMLSEAGPAFLSIGPPIYSLLDAAVLLLAAMVLLGRPGPSRSSAAAWLAAALALLLAADVASAGAGAPGNLLLQSAAGLPAVAYALIAIAAHADRVHAEMRTAAAPAASRSGDDVSFLPYAVLLLAMAALIYHQALDWREAPGVLAVVVCIVGVLVLLRQMLATREIAGKEAHFAKRAAEERFTSLVRNSSDVIAITRDDGSLLYLTPSAERVFGLYAEDLVGRPVTDLVTVEDRGRLQAFFAQLLSASCASATVELRIPRGKNRFRMVEVVGTNLMHEPHVSGHVLNIRDVTDRRAL
jgi:PAS domain S-box-containing protein